MANICLTSVCNRNCSYCFSPPEDPASQPFMSIERFRKTLEFLRRSEIKQIRILGGEPTLHPCFDEIMKLAMRSGSPIQLFSNGFMSEKTLDVLSAVDPERLTVVINASPFIVPDGAESNQLLDVLSRLGPRAMLGITMDSKNVVLDRLIPVIENTGIQRTIRVGLALPSLQKKNVWLRPVRYRDVGSRLTEFVSLVHNLKIRITLDCGFVPCMFGEDGLETLRRFGADIHWNCGPILDIETDGRILHCFPLAEMLSTPANGHRTAQMIRGMFRRRAESLRAAGIFPRCDRCVWKHSGECAGGCLAVALHRLRARRGG